MSLDLYFAIFSAVLALVSSIITYKNLKLNVSKDLGNELFNTKYKAYENLIEVCYLSSKRLSINSHPISDIYEFIDNNDLAGWETYFSKEISNLYGQRTEGTDLGFKYHLLLPKEILDRYLDFTNYCAAFVTMTYHFDVNLIIESEAKLWNKYIDLVDAMRSDLKMDELGNSLRKRSK